MEFTHEQLTADLADELLEKLIPEGRRISLRRLARCCDVLERAAKAKRLADLAFIGPRITFEQLKELQHEQHVREVMKVPGKIVGPASLAAIFGNINIRK